MDTPSLPYRIGCPVWACDQWADEVYPAGTRRRDWLRWYSRTFNTVEGNSTFYAIPSLETVEAWCRNSEAGFRFALKFPREITHERRLRQCEAHLDRFLEVLGRLDHHDRLGPSFLQLPPDFSPRQWDELEAFLRRLPDALPWAVEVRHFDWYDHGPWESRLDGLLSDLGIDKVLFDSRCLYSLPPEDAIEATSQTRKPKTPHRTTVTGKHPLVRFVGRNRLSQVEDFMTPWANVVARWIRSGLEPYFFTHAPDDRVAPSLARALHRRVCESLGETSTELPRPPRPHIQQSLF
jgi:uncharacterized protein YecE (DUF72 family)